MNSSAVLSEIGSNLAQPSVEEQKIYNSLVLRAKSLADQGHVPEALKLYRRALAIYAAPSLQRKIDRIEAYLAERRVKTEPPSSVPRTSYSGGAIRSPEVCRPAVIAACTSVRCDKASQQPFAEQGGADRGEAMSDDNGDTAQQLYARLVAEAREAIEQGDLEHALLLYKRAQNIRSGEKLSRRIEKIQRYLAEVASEAETAEHQDGGSNDEAAATIQDVSRVASSERGATDVDTGEQQDGDMVLLGDGFYVHELLASKLYGHQKEGVLWLWRLYQQRKGGILADDMGLGKTVQVIAFLSGLFDAQQAKTVLIVMPVSLIVNWQTEFERWAPGIPVYSYHGQTKRERERILNKVVRRGGVLLTSYGIVVTNFQALAEHGGKTLVWDCVILDEGHKIKNPTKTSKGVHSISARSRVVLTGTPVQNNLTEMWALFDFTHHGMLLGSSKTFKTQYEHPITRAREKCATQGEKVLGQEMAESLKRIISPYFLRRTKAEINARPSASNAATAGERKVATMPKLTKKNDLIVWLYLSEVQQKIYRDFIQLSSVKELLMSSKSPLTALTVLKKICDHPRLLSIKACCELGLDGIEMDSGLDETAQQAAASQIQSVSNEVLVAESGKMVFLVQLLDRLRAEGHRTLVFSQSRKMLDIIEKVMVPRGYKVIRLDGTVKDMQERDKRVQTFQNNKRYNLFLLTTQVGGIGLTLTAASRVVIIDPSWNPATDSQAVDRAFRIGQQQDVVIYRFITCGTVEEKIYRRQVFKDSLTKQATGSSKNPMRYFTQMQLRELFRLDDTRSSDTQKQLEQLHAAQRATDPTLDEHIAYLHSCDMFGISDHDLMFSVEDVEDEQADVQSAGEGYIKQRVEKARQLIAAETELQGRMNAVLGKYVPAQFSTTKSRTKGEKQDGTGKLVGVTEFGLDSVEDMTKHTARVTLDEAATSIGDYAGQARSDVEIVDEAIETDHEDSQLADNTVEVADNTVEVADNTVEVADNTVEVADITEEVVDDVPDVDDDAAAVADVTRSVFDASVTTGDSADVHDNAATGDDTGSADVVPGTCDVAPISSSASSSPHSNSHPQSLDEVRDTEHKVQGALCNPASTGSSHDTDSDFPSRRKTLSNFTHDLFEAAASTDKEGEVDLEHPDSHNIVDALGDYISFQLPVDSFTQDRAIGSLEDSFAKRKRLNRRSSCLPSLLKQYQAEESLDSDSDVEDSADEDAGSRHGADDGEDELMETAWESPSVGAGDRADVDDDCLKKQRNRRPKACVIVSDDEGTDAGGEAEPLPTVNSQSPCEGAGTDPELATDYSGPNAVAGRHSYHSEHGESTFNEEDELYTDESNDESDDLAADFDDSASSDNEETQDEQIRQQRRLREQAKQYYVAGDFRKSLLCLLKTLDDRSSERLQLLALRLKQKIST